MRKKSHVLLGRYLADQMSEVYSLQQHRKAFCLGNIMPDLRPSFLTTRHEFFGTFNQLQSKMRELVEKNPEEENARVYWRRFGEVMHYMADYFTFPHNRTYKGSLVEHNSYEAELKNRLKECILSGRADSQLEEAKHFDSFEELVEYIRERHAYYLESPRCIADDILLYSESMLSGDTGNLSVMCQKTIPYGKPTGNSIRQRLQCVRTAVFVFLYSENAFCENVNKK